MQPASLRVFQHCLLCQDGEDLSAVGGTEGAGIVDELVGHILGVSASGNDSALMLAKWGLPSVAEEVLGEEAWSKTTY